MPLLHIEARGSGPSVVLIHGAPSPPEHFHALANALSSDHRVLIPHLPGYGRTPPLPRPWTLAERDHLLGEALRSAGVGGAHLVGYSAGTLRCLSLALDGAIDALSIHALSGLSGLWPDEQAGFSQLAEAVQTGADLSAIVRARFLSEDFAATHPDAASEVVRWLSAVDQTTLADEFAALGGEQRDLTPRLASLRCRLTARAGTADLAIPVAHAEAMVAAAPDAVLERVEGAGHALLLEDFDGTLHSIRRALSHR